MTERDVDGFMEVVKNLQRVFPKRLEEFEQAQLRRDYFKALRSFPLSAITAGADAWIQRGKFFPKPAEWIDAIPRRPEAVDVPMMDEAAARDWLRAERLRWQDAPCGCQECVAANVQDKPRRFVPDADRDGRDVRCRLGDRIVTAGHWCHGSELFRYYDGKANFYNRFFELLQRRQVTP